MDGRRRGRRPAMREERGNNGAPPVPASGQAYGAATIGRRRLLKLAAYSVPAATLLNVSAVARAADQSPPPPPPYPQWVQLNPATNPPARSDGAMGWDLLFGGAGSLLNDLWEWADTGSGPDWLQLAPTAPQPAPRSRHACAPMPYWPDRLILFGGWDGQAYLGDTWIFRSGEFGDEWRQVNASPAPAPRAGHALAYAGYWDGSAWRQEVLLFGGQDGTDYLGDTWIFDVAGETWTQIPGPGPALRAGHSLSGLQWLQGKAVLFGGQGADGYLGDTWVFDFPSRTWTNLAITGPPARWKHAASVGWAPPDQGWGEACYVFGGEGAGGLLDDTWALLATESGGYEWVSFDLTPRPSARAGHAMSTEAVMIGPTLSGGLLLFGGAGAGGVRLGDTWMLELGFAPS